MHFYFRCICKKDILIKYIKDLLYICWCIVISQSQQLKLYTIYDNYKEIKNNNVKFDKNKYEFVYCSEKDDKLNYYVWPCLICKDNDHQLSKISALFLNKIPRYNKKH